jgi:hypothetical protein
MREKLTIRAFERAAAAGEIRLKLLDTLRRTETPQLTENNHSRHALLDTLSNIRGAHFFAPNRPSGEVSGPVFAAIPGHRQSCLCGFAVRRMQALPRIAR